MIEKLKYTFRRIAPRHEYSQSDAPKLYVTDWAGIDNKEVELSDSPSLIRKSVSLENKNRIPIFFDGFKRNALPITKSITSPQCECVLFPVYNTQDTWILFIETKYAADRERALKKEAGYPTKMVKQIKETVFYFRNKEIIPKDKVVHAIISFPNLMEDFNAWTFPIQAEDGTWESILDIRIKYGIIIRATNQGNIINERILVLN